MGSPLYPYPSQETAGEPLINPWYTPGWTSQNPDYQIAPALPFTAPGWPADVNSRIVTGNYFDGDSNALGGYLTFMPSADLVLTDPGNGSVYFIPARYTGSESFGSWGYNMSGSGRVYLRYGKLNVRLMCSDQPGLNPASFTYHVREHFRDGREYDIFLPTSATDGADINSLIVPGSTEAGGYSIAVTSTQYLFIDVSTVTGSGPQANPTGDVVQFAFKSGNAQPGSSDWVTGSWQGGGPPYLARILIGPSNGGLPLATGLYQIWIKIVDDPEVPVMQAGQLAIF